MAVKISVVDIMFQPESAQRIFERLEDKQQSIGWLAGQVGITYEHARKIVRGVAFPSKLLLPKICRALGLDKEEMTRLVISDRLKKKYGNIPSELAGETERSVKIGRLLPRLTDEQFENLLGMAEGWANRNRVAKGTK
jgi:hypothetical protein